MKGSVDQCLAVLAEIADRDVIDGTCESPRGSNRGRALRKFFEADDYKPTPDEGYAWCAAAVCYWVQEWLRLAAKQNPGLFEITAPRTAAAFGLIAWGKKNGCLVFTPEDITNGFRLNAQGKDKGGPWPQAGDIAVLEISHCGIVKAAPSRARGVTHFTAIEGNTDAAGSREGWQVARKARTHAQIRAFIRIPSKGQKFQ